MCVAGSDVAEQSCVSCLRTERMAIVASSHCAQAPERDLHCVLVSLCMRLWGVADW